MIHRLRRELQGRKGLQRVRDEKGNTLLTSGAIAMALQGFFLGNYGSVWGGA